MLKEALVAAIVAVSSSGTDTVIGPELTERGFPITVYHREPETDPYGNALRYYDVRSYLTTRCEINISQRSQITISRFMSIDISRFVVAHEFMHCMDEYPPPEGVNPSDWREAFADIGAVIITRAAGNGEYKRLLNIRPHLRGKVDEMLAMIRALELDGAGAAKLAVESCKIRNRLFAVAVDCHNPGIQK